MLIQNHEPGSWILPWLLTPCSMLEGWNRLKGLYAMWWQRGFGTGKCQIQHLHSLPLTADNTLVYCKTPEPSSSHKTFPERKEVSAKTDSRKGSCKTLLKWRFNLWLWFEIKNKIPLPYEKRGPLKADKLNTLHRNDSRKLAQIHFEHLC